MEKYKAFIEEIIEQNDLSYNVDDFMGKYIFSTKGELASSRKETLDEEKKSESR